MSKALQDIIVLDLGQIYNGPYCSLMMAFQGAKVIKIEPLDGEVLRKRRKEPHEFFMLNSNKLGIAIDLKTMEGKDLFREMVKKADVVVENFSRGVMDRLGIGYEALKEINPRLIYATGTGYGLEGPYADMPAMDLTIQAMGGVMATTGNADAPPLKAGPAFGDFLGGIHLYGGVMTALYQREKTGKGQLVEVSMHDSIYPTLASAIGGYYNNEGKLPERTGNRHSGLAVAPYNVYPVEDGFVAIFCVTEKHWKNLVRHMERSDLLDDPCFLTTSDRAENMNIIDELISAWTSTQKKWELVQSLLKVHVPCAPVLSIAEVADDPHLKHRQMIREVEHPERGKIRVPGSPIRLSDSPLDEVKLSPYLGEHTEHVLTGLFQLTPAQVTQLREKQVIR